MSIDVGEAKISFLADTEPLVAQLRKIQRALQAMIDVLNEEEPLSMAEVLDPTIPRR